MIAVTGATGAVGGAVARRLGADGVPHQLVVRDPARAPDSGGGIRVATGYHDTASMRAALQGCDVVLMVSGRESAHRVAEHSSLIEAAVDVGVQRVVYLSFQGAGADCTFTFGRDHWHTEQLIRASGLRFTFLRDCFYQGLLIDLCGPDGVLRGPAGDGAVAAVTQEDVAACAAAALESADESLDGTTLDVTGPAALTLAEAAAAISRASGRQVRYVPETVEEAYASRAHYGAPAFEVAGWVSSYTSIASGEVAAVSDTVTRLTGRPATSFDDYLRQRPELWRHLIPAAGS